MVNYRKHGLRMAESWLDEPIGRPQGCDVLLLQQYARVPEQAYSTPFCSLTLDLTLPEATLFDGLNRDTKYEVRRAQTKDGVECVHETDATPACCESFRAFYDAFASAKNLPGLVAPELFARAAAGTLHFSRAVLSGETVVWHVHLVTAHSACLLHSASQFRLTDDKGFRATIGRANRLLHWNDIVAFKAAGKRVYDFGGWYAGTDDEARLNINRFKEGFGGKRVEQLNAGLPLTWRGTLYLWLRHRLSGNQRKALRMKLHALTGR